MNNHSFAERFKSARVLSGMTLKELSEKLGENKVSKQALHKYEKGDVIPDADKIAFLSQALGVIPQFFERIVKVELKNPEFRKLKRLPAKEEDRIIEYTKDYLSRYLELEDVIGIRKEFKNPLADWPQINSFHEVEEASKKVRQDWKLGRDPIFNVVELLEDLNIKVIDLDVEESFDGMQAWVNETIPVIAYNKNKLEKMDRVRFTVMHELGHLLLKLDHLPHSKKEQFCNQFATAMLFPAIAAKMELGDSRQRLFIQELGHLKQQYGISIQATLFRLKDLGIISEKYFTQFYFYINQMNWRIDEPFDYNGVEKSNRFDQLLYRALAENLINIEKAADFKNQNVTDFKAKSFLFFDPLLSNVKI